MSRLEFTPDEERAITLFAAMPTGVGKRIHSWIGAVLLHDWDPIGVAHVPEAQDEYRGYVRGVYDVAVGTRSPRAVAEHLVKMERGHMGLSGWRHWKARLPIAQKILELVREVGPLP